MALPFGDYRPDVSDVNTAHSAVINNVVPRGDGYGPFQSFVAFTSALPARCRGFFFGIKADESISIFAGTETRLYRLNNTTFEWEDVSQGGSAYSAVNEQARWEFAQFNDKIIAVQQNVAPQVFDIDTDSAFSDLGGSPPQADHVTTINRFLVLSGILNLPQRIQWSALNDITGWTAGTDQSDFQDLPDGGKIQGVVGGELGIIVQENAVRRMIFQPGSPVIFSIDRIAKDVGCIAPHSITYINSDIYWLSRRGFVKANQSGAIQFIGDERVDRTFLADYDDSQPGLVFGAPDPSTHIVYFTYKSSAGADILYDKMLGYDWIMDRWAPADMTGEYLGFVSQPGFTLESLGTIGKRDISNAVDNGSGLIRLTVTSTSGWTTGDCKTISDVVGTTEANGDFVITVVNATTIDLQDSTFTNAYTSGGYVHGSIDDDIEASLDSFSTASLPQFAQFNRNHALGFFSGANLEAQLETGEQSAMSRRMFIRGFRPQTDADDVTGRVTRRENLNDARVESTARSLNQHGYVPVRVSTRHARACVTIAAGDEWTYATGVEPDIRQLGRR